MVEALSLAMKASLDAGDLEATRIAYEAIGKLLAEPPTGGGAEVVSIASRRREGGR